MNKGGRMACALQVRRPSVGPDMGAPTSSGTHVVVVKQTWHRRFVSVFEFVFVFVFCICIFICICICICMCACLRILQMGVPVPPTASWPHVVMTKQVFGRFVFAFLMDLLQYECSPSTTWCKCSKF